MFSAQKRSVRTSPSATRGRRADECSLIKPPGERTIVVPESDETRGQQPPEFPLTPWQNHFPPSHCALLVSVTASACVEELGNVLLTSHLTRMKIISSSPTVSPDKAFPSSRQLIDRPRKKLIETIIIITEMIIIIIMIIITRTTITRNNK